MTALVACSDAGDALALGGGVRPDDYAPTGPLPVDPRNPLEIALDPVAGGQQAWLSFEDHGGIARTDRFHGVHVRGHSVHFGIQGAWARAQLLLSPDTAPVEMRQVLQAVCGIRPEDWGKHMQYVEASDGRAAAGDLCDAFYARLDGQWNMVMMRCDVEMKASYPDRRNCKDFGR